ncbi:uncharacterized protein LOC135195322 [Macrobrachium nipponense]|uniref:uncharacterized protein LOC135195322 n=1 Tax=Macrobrachium nipponense TaxID=159736 RepID=UPI0030C81904
MTFCRWYQEELGKVAMSRSPPHITKEELVRLMKWKLSRGKFRPRLVQLADSNSEEIVKTASEKGIQLALKDKVKDAINELVVLKGIGPATASGILAACVPEKCCFFADEVANAIPALATLKYDVKEYMLLNQSMVECALRLNKELLKGDENKNAEADWTPHKVELALWTHSIIEQSKPELLADITVTPKEGSAKSKRRRLE